GRDPGALLVAGRGEATEQRGEGGAGGVEVGDGAAVPAGAEVDEPLGPGGEDTRRDERGAEALGAVGEEGSLEDHPAAEGEGGLADLDLETERARHRQHGDVVHRGEDVGATGRVGDELVEATAGVAAEHEGWRVDRGKGGWKAGRMAPRRSGG